MSKLFNTKTFQYSSETIHTVPHTKDEDRIGKSPDRQTDSSIEEADEHEFLDIKSSEA